MAVLYTTTLNVLPGEDFRMVFSTTDDLTDATALFKYRVYGGIWNTYSEVDPVLVRTENETASTWSIVFSLPWDDLITEVGDKTFGSWLLEIVDGEDVTHGMAQGFWKRGLDNV
jgi:hypothetical protein